MLFLPWFFNRVAIFIISQYLGLLKNNSTCFYIFSLTLFFFYCEERRFFHIAFLLIVTDVIQESHIYLPCCEVVSTQFQYNFVFNCIVSRYEYIVNLHIHANIYCNCKKNEMMCFSARMWPLVLEKKRCYFAQDQTKLWWKIYFICILKHEQKRKAKPLKSLLLHVRN